NLTSESEVNLTIARVILREQSNPAQLNITLEEIEIQRAEYFNLTSESEVNLTIARVILREQSNPAQLNITLEEIEIQRAEYF
ncbi:unnamed protein product, partial [Rotaria sordida]